MGSSAQLYNLGWSDFELSLKQTVSGLRSHGDLFDVTLAADGKSFPAHKLVLSASSPLLLDLLKGTPCKHPVILLPGVTAGDMELLLDFIYTGEVNVDSERVPSLLQAARLLEIHALSQGTVQTTTQPNFGETLPTDSIRPGDKVKDSPRSRQPKKRCAEEASPSSEKWPRWDITSKQNVETEVEKRSKPGHHVPSKQGSEAALALTALHNAVPGTSWYKTPDPRARVSVGEDADSLAEVPHHHLLESGAENEEQGNTESYSAIAAAADAAAVAAATLSDKKGASEQPVACPLCNFVIKQSRNLRRHLEIKHFGSTRFKKGKVKAEMEAAHAKDGNDTDNDSSTDQMAIDHVQVEIQSPSSEDNSMANATAETKEAHVQQYSQSLLQQYAHVPPAILSHQMVAPLTGYVPQHLPMLKGPHIAPHSLLAATVAQQAPHFLGLYGADNNSSPPHQ